MSRSAYLGLCFYFAKMVRDNMQEKRLQTPICDTNISIIIVVGIVFSVFHVLK